MEETIEITPETLVQWGVDPELVQHAESIEITNQIIPETQLTQVTQTLTQTLEESVSSQPCGQYLTQILEGSSSSSQPCGQDLTQIFEESKLEGSSSSSQPCGQNLTQTFEESKQPSQIEFEAETPVSFSGYSANKEVIIEDHSYQIDTGKFFFLGIF